MPTEDEAPSRRRQAWLLAVAGVLLVPLAVVWWPGCREYPPVSSPESLTLVRRLYTACNTKDEARLAGVETRLAELSAEGKVTAEEKRKFEAIIAKARGGKWTDAEKMARKFAQDQLGRGDDTPDEHDHPHPPPKAGGAK